MCLLDFFIAFIILLIGELSVNLLRKRWAKQCNYDCSKCKVWDCQRHICLEEIKKGSATDE